MKRIALGGEKGKGFYALVDDEDYELISQYKWFLGFRGYVMTNYRLPGRKPTCIEMQRLLAGKPGYKVDHKDMDKLNNQRSNLRVATHSQNNWNCGPHARNPHGFKGVSFDKFTGSWAVRLHAQRRKVHVGRFTQLRTAVFAHSLVALIYHGDFAWLNKMPEQWSERATQQS